ncbi:DUF4124 domain-containing protein [Halomonas sp. GD1P12]|uniref:DUF4124 domain-containing protein n=1 Tax=Halomonas sp. GD1P12 TaxID=2982691 RepID=UPI0021E4187F|nr:DUF4124 domain-containing protein [Halomonas sp. GD1P12]UYG00177.1 DUF4124 domain-containing protein [Halomonas sp. GD1P12]
MKATFDRWARRAKAPMLCVLAGSLTLWLAESPAQAQTVYRVVDESGRVTYTDNPESGGEAVTLAPLPSVQGAPPPPPSRSQARPGQPFMPYDRFAIESPAPDTRLDDTMTPVDVRVQPPLREDHQIRLLVNGEISQSALHSDAFWLTGLTQGAHRLEAELLDSQGRVQHRTEAVSIIVAPR